jgi:tRNA1Val (adenine37-N6)-methyltransferase
MKVNTDGVLLAALVESRNPQKILDIGTGTGLIALILAQRFPYSLIDAVEIDKKAANRAKMNFLDSPFYKRLSLFHSSIEDFYPCTNNSYDLIVSNPPFFLNSLKSDNPTKELARHTNEDFFKNLLIQSSKKLSPKGNLVLILPIETSIFIEKLIQSMSNLYVNEIFNIHSFEFSNAHRKILKIALNSDEVTLKKFVIYEAPGIYSSQYQNLLKDFLTIF